MDYSTAEDGQDLNTHKDKDFLTALPNELLVQIAERLPVREICRLRGQNRHLRNIVDTNEHLLVNEVVKHHRGRIQAEHRLLTDLADCDLFDALQRYYSHYGAIDGLDIPGADNPAHALTVKWNTIKGTSGMLAPSTLVIFSRLQSADNQNDRVFWRSKWMVEAASSLNLQSDLDALRKKLESASVASCAAYAEPPLVFHTTRCYGTRHAIPGGYDAQDPMFHEGLGLPLLDADDCLAYCSDNVRAIFSLQRIALSGLTVLQKADILENLYIW